MCQDIYNSYDLFNHPGVGDKTSALYAASTARHSIFPGILSYASFLTSPPRTVGTYNSYLKGLSEKKNLYMGPRYPIAFLSKGSRT